MVVVGQPTQPIPTHPPLKVLYAVALLLHIVPLQRQSELHNETSLCSSNRCVNRRTALSAGSKVKVPRPYSVNALSSL
jgi:hypothetical protein